MRSFQKEFFVICLDQGSDQDGSFLKFISAASMNSEFRKILLSKNFPLYVTVFWKTDRIDTNTEIHFLHVDESHTHALFRDTKHLRLDGQVCFTGGFFPML